MECRWTSTTWPIALEISISELGHHQSGVGPTPQYLLRGVKPCNLLSVLLLSTDSRVLGWDGFGALENGALWLRPLVGVEPELTSRKMLFLNELQLLVAPKETTTAARALLSDGFMPVIKAAFARVCVKVGTEDSASVAGAAQDLY